MVLIQLIEIYPLDSTFHLLDNYNQMNRSLTFNDINLIGPWSTFAIRPAGCRFAVLVKSLVSCSTGCTPSSILNRKHLVSFSLCSRSAFCNGVSSTWVRSTQKGVFSFQCCDGSIRGILEATNSFEAWRKMEEKLSQLH